MVSEGLHEKTEKGSDHFMVECVFGLFVKFIVISMMELCHVLKQDSFCDVSRCLIHVRQKSWFTRFKS